MSARLVPARDHSHAKGRGEPVALKEGENLVGRDRKSAAVWIDDKRCSRKQAVLTWTKEGAGSLEITVSGTNPCFLCGKEGGKPTPLTKKEGSTALRHGDTICLLALEFPFVVELTGSEDDEDELIIELSSEEEGEDAMQDNEDGDTRPPCEYGTSCYRKNEDHNRKFYHSHKDIHGDPREVPKAPKAEKAPKAKSVSNAPKPKEPLTAKQESKKLKETKAPVKPPSKARGQKAAETSNPKSASPAESSAQEAPDTSSKKEKIAKKPAQLQQPPPKGLDSQEASQSLTQDMFPEVSGSSILTGRAPEEGRYVLILQQRRMKTFWNEDEPRGKQQPSPNKRRPSKRAFPLGR